MLSQITITKFIKEYVEMILQKVLFSSIDGVSDYSMCYHTDDTACPMNSNGIFTIPASTQVDFNSYYNAFSLSKWQRYTYVRDVTLTLVARGNAVIKLYSQSLSANTPELIVTYDAACLDNTKLDIPFSPLPSTEDSIVYFTISAVSDFAVFECAYASKDNTALNEVYLALNICTYRREADLKRNLSMLQKNIFDNPNSVLYNQLEVFVTDNAKSLNINEFSSEYIHVFPNKNVGGTGGFTRGLIEILNYNEKISRFTHAIFMDDDIILDISALERTYVLLQWLKPEYQSACIGGAMLRRDIPYMMYECGARWNGEFGEALKQDLDLRVFKNVLKSEQGVQEESIHYQGWWYCCFCLKSISKKQLPLPFFIHRDDIEYSLRLNQKIITLNGICVWHEPFKQKHIAFLEYYDIRNAIITNIIHDMAYSSAALKKVLLKYVVKNIFRLHYQETKLNFRSIEDFCKGIDWLKTQDGELLHQEISKLGYKKYPHNEITLEYDSFKQEEKILKDITEINSNHKLWYLLTLNGWLIPASQKAKIPGNLSEFRNYCGIKHALIYYSNEAGYIVSKSWKQAWLVIKEYFQICKLINKRYDIVRKEYELRYKELTDIAFWKDYLEI